MSQQQIPRPTFGLDQYHDVIAFQSFQLMHAQLGRARLEGEVAMLAEQLAETKKKLQEAEERLALPVAEAS